MSIKSVGLILARGGSKRLPRKALLHCAGKPLIDWTIEAASQSGVLSDLVISTDDHEIAKHCRSLGVSVPFERPADLATDDATSLDAIVHAIRAMGWRDEHLVLLQPTSPTRTSVDIRSANALMAAKPESSVLSVVRLDLPLSWIWVGGDHPCKLSKSFQLPADSTPLFRPNGAIYMRRAMHIEAQSLLIAEDDCQFLEMPKDRSVDVDTLEDLDLAERLLRTRPSTADSRDRVEKA